MAIEWFASSWETITLVVLSTAAIYVSTLIGVRLAGRRTLAQMSAFDFVVTIALSTIVASTAVTKDPSVAEGITALFTLLLLQAGIATLRQRWARARRRLDFSPLIVIRNGDVTLDPTIFTARMTRSELFSKLRQQGFFDLSDIRLAILEPTGEVSVVTSPEDLDKEVVTSVTGGDHAP